jgi:hypothetical protein
MDEDKRIKELDEKFKARTLTLEESYELIRYLRFAVGIFQGWIIEEGGDPSPAYFHYPKISEE